VRLSLLLFLLLLFLLLLLLLMLVLVLELVLLLLLLLMVLVRSLSLLIHLLPLLILLRLLLLPLSAMWSLVEMVSCWVRRRKTKVRRTQKRRRERCSPPWPSSPHVLFLTVRVLLLAILPQRGNERKRS
jgi:hypothetical protein